MQLTFKSGSLMQACHAEGWRVSVTPVIYGWLGLVLRALTWTRLEMFQMGTSLRTGILFFIHAA